MYTPVQSQKVLFVIFMKGVRDRELKPCSTLTLISVGLVWFLGSLFYLEHLYDIGCNFAKGVNKLPDILKIRSNLLQLCRSQK